MRDRGICSRSSVWKSGDAHVFSDLTSHFEVSNFAMRSGAADAWKAWMDYTTKCSMLRVLLPLLTDSGDSWTFDDHFQETEETSNRVHIVVEKEVYIYLIIEGSLEAKLPTIWRDGNGTARKKLGRGESQTGETRTWRKSEGRR